MEMVAQWFIYFIIYSILGYFFEIVYCFIYSQHKIENRGFLFGPLCPIYGWGMIAILLCYEWLQWPWWANFFLIVALCSTLEYLTSYLMEKIFHVRWWDYSQGALLDLNGRIALFTSLGFGVGGLIVIYLVQPVIAGWVALIPPAWLLPIAAISLIILALDTFMSFMASLDLKVEIAKGVKIESVSNIKRLNRSYYQKDRRVERKVTRKTKRVAKKQAKRG